MLLPGFSDIHPIELDNISNNPNTNILLTDDFNSKKDEINLKLKKSYVFLSYHC